MLKYLLILFFSVSCFAGQVSRLDNRIVVYYQMNENGGLTTTDVSGKGNHGKLVGAQVAWVTGKHGSGVDSPYVATSGIYNADVTVKTDSGTIVFWGSQPHRNVAETAVYVGNSWANGFTWYEPTVGFRTPTAYYITYPYNQANWQNDGVIRDGTWHHYAVTWNATKEGVNMFRDGVFYKCAYPSAPAGTTYTSLSVGCRDSAGDSPIGLSFDDFTIYNTDLSTHEVVGIFRGGMQKHRD